MARAYPHLDMEERLVTFAQHRIYELKEELANGNAELEMWEGILKRLKVCEHCGGKGKVGVFIAQDEKTTEPCKPCEGTGFLK